MSEKVEMRPAYSWTCPECGQDNFERVVVPEMSDEDLREMKEEFGIDEWEEGDFQSYPNTVQCEFCSAILDTKPPQYDSGEDGRCDEDDGEDWKS